MPEQPHFKTPFKFGPRGQSPEMLEQGSDEEIEQCVENILRYKIGFREDLSSFGIPDYSFDQAPVDLNPIIEAIIKFEPRAVEMVTENPEMLEEMIENIIVKPRGQ